MKKAVTYNYSTTEIIARGEKVSQLVKEDLEQFQRYGVTQKDIDVLEKKLEEYRKYPEDQFFADKVKAQTLEKNNQEQVLIDQIRNFFLQKYEGRESVTHLEDKLYKYMD